MNAAMLAQLAGIVAPIVIAAGVGAGWARSGMPYPRDFVRRLVMNVGTPCLIVSTIGQADVGTRELLVSGGAALLVVLLTILCFALVLRMARLDTRVFLPPMVFPNCGNMGLPLALFAFGHEGLALALAFFVAMTLSHFTVGLFITSGIGELRQVLRTPIVHAGLLAIALQLGGIGLPAWVANTLELLGSMTIPLMLITLGVSLASVRVATLGRAAWLSVGRLAGGVAAGWLVATLLGLDGVARGVVILQAAMPAAVVNYLIALHYERSPEEVAGVVVVSTLLSMATLPLLLLALLQL